MWQAGSVVPCHEELSKAGILHYYDDTQAVGHAWDAKWMAPTIEALMKLCQAGKTK
jgi:enterochelin esterase-like enzyme